jgi:hypothetical protein
MSLPKTAVFCWSGDPGRAAFFLEEALCEWSASASARPLLVDCQPKKGPELSLDIHSGRELPLSALRLLGETGLPCLRGSDLPRAVEEAAKKGSADYIEESALIVLPLRGEAPACAEFSSEFLFFAPAAEESVSALRDLALGLRGRAERSFGISVVVSGIEKIEEAAEFFLGLKDGLSKLPLLNAELRFAGHFFLKEEKERIAKESGERYGKLFFRDGLCGQLKAIGRRWLPLTGPATGCGSLLELAEKIAALAY